MADIDEIFKKYGKKIESQINTEQPDVETFSREYQSFKRELTPELSKYERWCTQLGSVIKINLAAKDNEKIQKQLSIAHLEVAPSQVVGLAVMALMSIFFLGGIFFAILFLLGQEPFIILFLTLLIAIFVFYYLYTMPQRLANKWRLKASSQMVPCILYIVAFMKHTSNLERAIVFAAKHLQPPLALDFSKVFYDLETGKYSTIKDSLESYLQTWRETNMEFVESFHLIESSLYEPSEDRRVQILERSLQVILDGVYEKMLKYARDVRTPMTNIYMLGIVLPTLGISLIPLASTLMGGILQWYHLILMFDLIIPFFVFYLTSEALMKRPGGYGESESIEFSPGYEEFASKKSYFKTALMLSPLVILGFLPFIFNFTGLPGLIGLKSDYTFSELGLTFLGDMKFFDFKTTAGVITGPFGLGAIILSLCIPLAIALFFSIVYKERTKRLIGLREDTRKLESEFTNSLFQLGNRLGDGVPAEMAFSYVADATHGQITEGFFQTVSTNLHQAGMSLEEAIFNRNRGAIVYYPSALISTSMRILIESSKKGLQIAARSLMSISEYVKNIGKINDRMKDLLAEVISDMKSNMTFLAPLLAGIVVGLGSMITNILNKLQLDKLAAGGEETSGLGGVSQFIGPGGLFDISNMIPPYYLQLAIGIYIVEIVFILSNSLVTIDAGEDKLRSLNEIGKNLRKGVTFYLIVALIAILALSGLAAVVLPSGGFG